MASAQRNVDELIDAAQGHVAALSGRLEAMKSSALGGPVNAADLARHLYRQRRRREQYFSAKLFGEPGWDLLLDLYIARCEGKKRSTKSACIGSGVAQTTALRWLERLEKEGLILRWRDVHDERQTLISLTDEAFARVTAHLQRLSGLARETSRWLS
jgi:DNA-binding transcriptional ArsR family regulator